MNYKIITKVRSLELKSKVTSAYKTPTKDDKEATTTYSETMGWFVAFEGSHESLFVGWDKPENLDPGTEVEIIIKPRRSC